MECLLLFFISIQHFNVNLLCYLMVFSPDLYGQNGSDLSQVQVVTRGIKLHLKCLRLTERQILNLVQFCTKA